MCPNWAQEHWTLWISPPITTSETITVIAVNNYNLLNTYLEEEDPLFRIVQY